MSSICTYQCVLILTCIYIYVPHERVYTYIHVFNKNTVCRYIRTFRVVSIVPPHILFVDEYRDPHGIYCISTHTTWMCGITTHPASMHSMVYVATHNNVCRVAHISSLPLRNTDITLSHKFHTMTL